MARALCLFSAVFLLFLLLVATEIAPVMAQARTCDTPSQRFDGCGNCDTVCQAEGFVGGHCLVFAHRLSCLCRNPCRPPAP